MNDLLILCYHAVSPSWPAALSVTPDALESQMTKLARAGYRGVRFSDALGLGEQLEGRVVSVTFDDNYRSVLEFAKPILTATATRAPSLSPPTGRANRARCSGRASIIGWGRRTSMS